jgi:hypothetical protein
MALMEVTGDVFSKVKQSQEDMNDQIDHILARLTELYNNYVLAGDLERSFNLYILDSLVPAIKETYFSLDDVASFIEAEEGQVIIQRIRDRREDHLLYRQPVILLLYYMAFEEQYRRPLKREWPLSQEELAPISTDLGTSLAAA